MRYRTMRYVPLLVAVLGMLTCTSCLRVPLADRLPPLFPNAHRMVPYPLYAVWWAQIEACTGETESMRPWQWYWVPGWHFHDGQGPVLALTEIETDSVHGDTLRRVYVSERNIMDSTTIKHEMLHMIGLMEHSKYWFVDQCHVESAASLGYQRNPQP